jgi:hypothetical protein
VCKLQNSKKQINGGIITAVTPFGTLAGSIPKGMESIAQSNFMTLLSRKGLKTEFKHRMNIRGQYFMKLSV